MRSKLLGYIVASAVVVTPVLVASPRLPAVAQTRLASGTCYEVHQGTLTPGEPITVCTP